MKINVIKVNVGGASFFWLVKCNVSFCCFTAETAVMPEDTEEREKISVMKDANSAQSSDELKRKIEELQNASLLNVLAMT